MMDIEDLVFDAPGGRDRILRRSPVCELRLDDCQLIADVVLRGWIDGACWLVGACPKCASKVIEREVGG